MPRCPNCGSQQPDGAAFCDECGEALGSVAPSPQPVAPAYPPTVPAMNGVGGLVCSKCGEPLEPDSAFCDMCGQPVGAPAQGGPPVAPPPAYDYPQPPQPAQPASIPSQPSYGAPAQARLVIQDGQASFPLRPDKPEIIMGREDPISSVFPDIDLTDYGGDDKGVSREHARISFRGGQAFIEDLGSTNHTFVNQKELAPRQPHPLNNGDEVRLGRLKLTFYT